MTTLPDDLTFEQALAQLEEAVNKLEDGDLSLAEAVAMFERGQQLTLFCQGQLDNAELRVQQLTDQD